MAHEEIDQLIEQLPATFQPEAAGDMNAVLQFNLTGEKSGEFYTTISNGACTATAGTHDSPTMTVKAEGQDWLDMSQGKADGMNLFMQGKLKIEGDMGLAMKMQSIFKRG